MKVARIACYPLMPGFVEASAQLLLEALAQAPGGSRVLFSAHGLPEKIIATGDPYQFHCEQSATAIAREAGLAEGTWRVCYQSRIGPLKWIGPSLQEELENAKKDGVGVVIYPHAFVSEHVETLVELDIEYRRKARDMGLPYFGRARTVSAHPLFIQGLAALVQEALDGKPQARLCGERFSKCGCRRAA